MSTPEYLDRTEAAAYLTRRGLRLTKGTLGKFATVGGGPPFQRFGNRAVYTANGLDAWVAAKLKPPRRSTSEVARDDAAPEPTA